MTDVLLARPTVNHVELMARYLFMDVVYPPFESEQEMIEHVRTVSDMPLHLSLFIVAEKRPIGAVRTGLFNHSPALLQLTLLPEFRPPEVAQPIVEQVLAQLHKAHPELKNALYEEAYRSVFEKVGCQTEIVIRRMMAPVVKRPVPAGIAYRLARPEDLPGIRTVMQAAYGWTDQLVDDECGILFDTDYAEKASFVVEEDGRIVSANFIQGSTGQKQPYNAHTITLPAEQKKGYGVALVQASMNVLADLGCTDVLALCNMDNVKVNRLLERSGFVPTGLICRGSLPGKN